LRSPDASSEHWVKEEKRPAVAHARQNQPSHVLERDTPWENIKAMVEAIDEFSSAHDERSARSRDSIANPGWKV